MEEAYNIYISRIYHKISKKFKKLKKTHSSCIRSKENTYSFIFNQTHPENSSEKEKTWN